jgi:hypothetical protein
MKNFEAFIKDLFKSNRPTTDTESPEYLNKHFTRIPRERENYEPFSGENKRCPKCGSQTITYTYRPPNTFFDVTTVNILGVYSAEWMLRTCRECQYKWPEECPTYPLSD